MLKETCGDCLAMSAYGLALRMLMPIVIFPDLRFMLYITAAASFAYFIGSFAIIAASHLLNVDVHTQRCREWTAIRVFGTSLGNGCVLYGWSQAGTMFIMSSYFAATVYLHCSSTTLWTGATKRLEVSEQEASTDLLGGSHHKKRRVSTLVRKQGHQGGAVDGTATVVAATVDSPPGRQSRRYNLDFWGRAWTNGSDNTFKDAEKYAAKSEEARTQLYTDCFIDADACLELLLQLDPHDLEERLKHSPFNQLKMSEAQSWLREAAAVCDVSLYKPYVKEHQRQKKSKVELIADVLAAVSSRKTAPIAPLTYPRYSASVWGKTERKKAVRSNSTAPKRALRKRDIPEAQCDDNNGASSVGADDFHGWDLAACRSLLVRLDENDLKQRLEQSPWNPWSPGDVSDAVNWLKEASAAYDILTRESGNSGNHRSKQDIITDILRTVRRSKALNQGV